jgi:hypothetical protein
VIRTVKARLRGAAIAAVEEFDAGLDRRLFRDPHVSDRSAWPGRWLSPEERRLAEVLAARVLPSDGAGPGSAEADVAGAIDRVLAAASPEHRAHYGRGLHGLDRMSRRRSGSRFADLPESEQNRLLEDLTRVSDRRFEGPVARRIPHRLTVLYYRWRFPAVDFFSRFVDDVFEAFYTSPVAWKWLGYDGPPMPLGYLDPTRPRT